MVDDLELWEDEGIAGTWCLEIDLAKLPWWMEDGRKSQRDARARLEVHQAYTCATTLVMSMD